MMEFLQKIPKKAIAAIITALVIFLNDKVGLGIDQDTVNQIVAVGVAFIVGQGIADHGKGAMQEQARIAVKVDNGELPPSALPTGPTSTAVASTPPATLPTPSNVPPKT